jgi:ornithine cyclodeaminase/alanine dehydrogenase-like protein (mu-crystallin family)
MEFYMGLGIKSAVPDQPLVLTNEQVEKALTFELLIPALARAFKENFTSYRMTPRYTLSAGESAALIMSCHSGSLLGVKVSTLIQELGRGPKVLRANYSLFDGRTGDPCLFMDADVLTDLRTAATSAVATDALALPQTRTLGVFGTGRLAKAHIAALLKVRDFSEVLVCGSSPAKSNSFAEQVTVEYGVPVRPVNSATCAEESDVICTCTTSNTPLFDGSLLRQGTHLNLVGAFSPNHREVDTTTVKRAQVLVDSRESALAEAGDLLIPMRENAITSDHILADLHELLSGGRLVRMQPTDITLFKSVGCAIEDVVAAEILLGLTGR